jgi:transcriptional regulator with XRE-family HTH domain
MSVIMAEKQESFGYRLRRLMKASGLTIETVAWRAGVHPNSINKWLDGSRQPRFDVVCRLADAMGVGLEDLRVLPRATDAPHPPKPRKNRDENGGWSGGHGGEKRGPEATGEAR